MSAFIRKLIHESYAQAQLFFMLGFEPDDVFIEVINVLNAAPDPGLCVTVCLKKDGRRCTYTVHRVTEHQSRVFMAEMADFMTKVKPKLSRQELDAIVKNSRAWAHKVDCIASLNAKGFDVEVGRMLS